MEKSALEGIKVAEFAWVLAGPLTCKYLADFGATVVRIESMRQPDLARTAAPYKDKKPGINRSGNFGYYNANKYSVAINLTKPEGREVAKRLVKWADIVSENFTPGRMEQWGLGYEDLKKIKPDTIMLRSSNQGQTGPHAKRRGFGILLASMVGFNSVIGWPDRGPTSMYLGYTDFIAPRLGAASLLAALDYHRKTGKGQLIDISQFEAGLQFLSPLVLDYIVNKREPRRMGNSCEYAAPHAAYRCRGEDRWCVISIFNDGEWKALCKAMGNPEWTKDGRFATIMGRKENESDLDRLIEGWTIQFSAEEVMARLQAAGIAAGVIESTSDAFYDPQLRHRNHFWLMEHPEIGQFHHLGQSIKMSKTPAVGRMPAPCLGEHTEYVCREFLGMSDEEFVSLIEKGVLE